MIENLSIFNGTWSDVMGQWQDQCHEVGEDFQDFEPVRLNHLQQQCKDSEICHSDIGIRPVSLLGKIESVDLIYWYNKAPLPKTSGLTLRVREIIFGPNSYNNGNPQFVEKIMFCFFQDIIKLSNIEKECETIKIHATNPNDLDFLEKIGNRLHKNEKIIFAPKRHNAWIVMQLRKA